jgi:hypothetical protein
MHTYLVYVVESNPGSMEGRVILLDQNCASVWNFDFIYFFCTPLIMTLSYVESASESMGYLILTGGHRGAHSFLSGWGI